jgi:serine/threonine protein kinase
MSTTPPPDDDDRTRVLVPGNAAAPGGSGNAVPAASVRPSAGAAAASSAGDSGNALPLGTYLSEFELTGVVGEGGFGIVYMAWDHSLQRKVALKEYMPASLATREQSTVRVRSARHKETFDAGLKSFINEARLLAQFAHPSLVKVYRFWEANGTAYMEMPLYEGTTFKDRVRAMPQPPDEEWLKGLLAPLTEALAVLHSENCFHRDIAPDNVILLAGTQRPLLLDFGAARRVIGDMTQALTVILKPGYAPVEQYAESPDMKQGAWTDIYALAATVHWAITGTTPPPAVSRLVNDSFQPLSSAAAGRYGERFLGAIDRALAVRPEHRTSSIAAFRADLGLETSLSEALPGNARVDERPNAMSPQFEQGQAHRTELAVGAPGPGTAPRSTNDRPASTRTGLWVAAAVVLIAVGGIGGFMMLGKAPSPQSPAAVNTSPTPATAAAPVTTAEAPAPPAVSAAPPQFRAEAELEKLMAAQTPDFTVQATPAKSVLRIGRDRLSFDVTSNRDGFVHVLLRGPDGSLSVLFPNDQAKNNRIRAGQRLQLPHANWPLEASEPAGSEQFVVFVSGVARNYGDFGGAKEYIFTKLPTDERAVALASTWNRGTPLLLGAPAADCQGSDCSNYGAATFTVQVVR